MQLRCFQCRQTENRCDASSVVASVNTGHNSVLVGPVCMMDLLQSADTQRESHTGWMRVSLCMSVLYFIHLCTYSIRSSLCHMPPVIRGHSASRERCGSPHPWVMLKSCGLQKGGRQPTGNPESSRTKRLDKHDPQTNAQGPDSNDLMRRLFSSRMKTKTFSFTPRAPWWMMSTLTTCDTSVCLTGDKMANDRYFGSAWTQIMFYLL